MCPKQSGPGAVGQPTRLNFTQARLNALPAPKAGRVVYRDARTPGLCVRVSPTGHKAAYLSKKVKGRHLKLKLGTWPQDFGTLKALRDAAERALGQIDGSDHATPTGPSGGHSGRSMACLGRPHGSPQAAEVAD